MPDAYSANYSANKAFDYFILLTAAICGAIIMMIEVLGSRVVGPFFGVSLFVWTSLITVTLLSLAAGYAFGGVVADKRGHPAYLYAMILFAGVLCLLLPFAKVFVLKACMGLGLRSGAFVSTLILFGPGLFLLGCVSPYLVKLATAQLQHVGKVVGGLYAISTLGSTAGTLVTGFWAVGYWGIDSSFYVLGVFLIGLSFSYFLFFMRRWKIATAVLLSLLLIQPTPQFQSKQLSDGTMLTKLAQADNYYGSIKVVQTEQSRKVRYLLLDNTLQGAIDIDNGLSVFPYVYYLQFLSYANNPNGQHCLAIGLGVGIALKWLERQGVVCDVVDINPNMFSVAKQYFSYVPAGRSIVQDGRYFLESSSRHYDYIILDVFSAESTPAHLLSQEALSAVKRRLNPGGVVALNLISKLEGEQGSFASIIATLETVFDNVESYPTFDARPAGATLRIGNIVVLAYPGPAKSLRLNDIQDFQVHPVFKAELQQRFGMQYHINDFSRAVILRDDFNPLDYFDADIREHLRRDLQKWLDVDLQLL